MKLIFVGLIVGLAFVALTQAASSFEGSANSDTCALPTVCGKRQDGFCQKFIDTCQLKSVNCMVNNAISREWTPVDDSECSKLSDPNKIGVCDSTCKKPCVDKTPTCGANTSGSKCKMYYHLCEIQYEACKGTDVFPALLRRCKDAGIIELEAEGKCAPE